MLIVKENFETLPKLTLLTPMRKGINYNNNINK
jgi:hypothetical protein